MKEGGAGIVCAHLFHKRVARPHCFHSNHLDRNVDTPSPNREMRFTASLEGFPHCPQCGN